MSAVYINLSKAELEAVLWAVSQHTDGNGRDVDELMLEGLTEEQAVALFAAEKKLKGTRK